MDLTVKAQLNKALEQAARSAQVADQGVVLDVTWVEPHFASLEQLITQRLQDWSGMSLVDANVAVDTLLDIRALLRGSP
jgi:hypothetical protein